MLYFCYEIKCNHFNFLSLQNTFLNVTLKRYSLSSNAVKTLTRLLNMHQYAYENEIQFQQAVEAVNKIRNKYPVPTEPGVVFLPLAGLEWERWVSVGTSCWWRTVIVPTASRDAVIDRAIDAQWEMLLKYQKKSAMCFNLPWIIYKSKSFV